MTEKKKTLNLILCSLIVLRSSSIIIIGNIPLNSLYTSVKENFFKKKATKQTF